MPADGGEAIADPAVLRDQGEVFGPVASTPTARRLLARYDGAVLAWLRAARASAREVAWMQAAETGQGIPAVQAGGRELPGLVLDLDATLITSHSEKEQAAPTYRGGFGFHPLLCFLANTGEAMSGRLRPGNSGAGTAADHIAVLDDALAQLPAAHRYGIQILVRADNAGSAKAFLTHIRTWVVLITRRPVPMAWPERGPHSLRTRAGTGICLIRARPVVPADTCRDRVTPSDCRRAPSSCKTDFNNRARPDPPDETRPTSAGERRQRDTAGHPGTAQLLGEALAVAPGEAWAAVLSW
ncbi:transposase [Streptomyces scopuliridis]|uniref:transposase n=1 Tax=Streptomyces scopuliridis TaxID=452529 RepID=UPI00369D05C9